MKLSEAIGKQNRNTCTHPVSIHACERFAERIMKQEVLEGSLSFVQIKNLTTLILRILAEEHPEYKVFGNGSFKCPDYKCIFITRKNIVVTTKKHIEDESELTYLDFEEQDDTRIPKTERNYRKGKMVYKDRTAYRGDWK